MIIAFTGAHRVGKTSLAEEIAKNLPQYEFKNEPYLQLEEMGYSFLDIPTCDDYMLQFNQSVKQLENSGKDEIFDRCPLDLLAYLYATGEKKMVSTLFDKMLAAMSGIDLLIFIPIESPDRIVCHESDLPRLRHKVNDILQNWIGDMNIEIAEVQGSLENRKKQLMKKILQKNKI